MTTSAMSTGTWVSIDECCPVRYQVDGSDLATIVIGDDDQSVALTFNATGLLRLAEVSRRAVAEVTALEAQEATEPRPRPRPTLVAPGEPTMSCSQSAR